MQKEERDFWTALIIFGALLILIWAILKAIGVIKSPVWIEMIPYIGGGLSIIGGAYKLGKIKRGIEQTEEKVDKILELEGKFNRVEHEHNLAMNGKLNINHSKIKKQPKAELK